MSDQLIKRAEELSLLGWSQEGARIYSELLDNEQSFMGSSINTILLFSFIALVALIFGSILVFRFYRKPLKEIQVKSDVDNEIVQESIAKSEIQQNVTKNMIKSAINISNMAVEYISADQSIRRPFAKQFYNLFQETSINTNSLIEHSILATLLTYEASLKAIKSISSVKELSQGTSYELHKINNLRDYLTRKNDEELMHILKDCQLLNGLSKHNLIDLILDNPDTLKKSFLQKRKEELSVKTVLELKNLLKGQEKISRLRKSELIDKVLYLEYGNE